MQWLDELAKEAYELLIANGSPVKLDTYCEKHHIIPRSLGGSDDAENLVYLTAGEHLYAHYWLWVGTGEHNMAIAYFGMANTNWRKYDDTPLVTDAMVQAYEEARVAHAEKARDLRLGSKLSDDHKKSIGESVSGSKHPLFGVPVPESRKMKISKSLTGERHPGYGIPRRDSVKSKISETKKSQKNWNSRPVKSESGEFWPNAKLAAECFGVHGSTIRKWILAGKNGLSYATNNDVSTTGDI